MAEPPEIDDVTGVETTGHEWDGIKELNKPLPKWWLWVFYATIVWSVGYWILMPAWPLVRGHTEGLLGYSQRAVVSQQIADARAAQGEYLDRIATSNLATIRSDPDLLRFAMAGGEAAFGDNCAGCHGRAGQGAPGYPSLSDDAWLWGGSLDAIHETILYGIRSSHPETRQSQMPAFGRDGLLSRAEMSDVADYVLSLRSEPDDPAAAERGKAIYEVSCAGCHGIGGEGNSDLGAPSLADAIWLYGGDKASIVESIRTGRGGMMPAWIERLDDTAIKQLAVYVHALGGGE